MTSDNRRLKYEPPKSNDLSSFSATGDDLSRTAGVCKSGASPFYDCVAGNSFLGSCSTGGTPDTSACSPGGYHLYPACGEGSDAATICLSGNGQN